MSAEVNNVIFVITLLLSWTGINSDKPCAAREYFGRSVVCVCNETYCDELVRETPGQGEYVSYTTSRAGSRFKKSFGRLISDEEAYGCCSVTLDVDPEVTYQTIEGFGGAVTDAAGINWRNMSDVLQKHLIDAYFSDKGHRYNSLRVPIGGTDFSTHPYAYNELPQNDVKLSNFSLSYEDFQFKIPLIKAAMETASEPIHITASPWSPPPWMKTNNDFVGFSELKEEYYQTFADYILKFVDEYSKNGIPVWSITTTNEPFNGVIPIAQFNSLGWWPSTMGKWIINNLGPTVRNSKYKHLKIFTLDDQRYTIPFWFSLMVQMNPKVLDYIDGVAVHFYGNTFTSPSFLLLVTKMYPKLFVMATEAAEGIFELKPFKVILGSWKRAEHYMSNIITDLNYNVIGWLDWNLCLNEEGGPAWPRNFVDSQIVVFPEKGEFIKQPMYYAMGHFSKFMPRGSRRIKLNIYKKMFTPSVDHVAVLTPYNTVVVVIYNKAGNELIVAIKLGNKVAIVAVEPNSFVTVELFFKDPSSTQSTKDHC